MTAGNLFVEMDRRLDGRTGDYDVVECRLWTRLSFDIGDTNVPVSELCLVDTGAPYCVIPKEIWEHHGFVWDRLNYPLDPQKDLTWQGVPCTLGRVNVWYVPHEDLDPRGPFSLVAKFVDHNLETELRDKVSIKRKGKDLLPILLGMSFLHDHWCHMEFDSHYLRRGGVIEFP